MMRWPPRKKGSELIDPQGRLLGLSEDSGAPIFAPPGHSILLSSNGGGKTTSGAMPWAPAVRAFDHSSNAKRRYHMKIIALFVWMLVPLGLWIGYQSYGTPHAALTYQFRDNGDIYNPSASRHYLNCTYYGIEGAITMSALNGTCPWIRFFKAGS